MSHKQRMIIVDTNTMERTSSLTPELEWDAQAVVAWLADQGKLKRVEIMQKADKVARSFWEDGK